jgi:hypothetical protein
VLEQLAKPKKTSISSVVRDAIALKQWYDQVVDGGGRVLVDRGDGRLREIYIRR